MLEILERAGFDPRELHVMAELGSTEAIRQAIKAKVGGSILSRRAIADDLRFQELCEMLIRGITFFRHLYLVTHKKRAKSPVGQAFVDFLAAK